MKHKLGKTALLAALAAAVALLLADAPALGAPAFVARVAFDFEEGTAVFYRGSEAGIAPGDIFEAARDGVAVATLEAEQVKPFYTRARLLSGVEKAFEASASPTAATVGPQDSDNRFFDKDSPMPDGLKKELDIALKGYRYALYRAYGASGNERQFLSTKGLINRGASMEQASDLNITATYGKELSLTGNLSESPNIERKMRFDLGTGGHKASFGLFSPDFRSGSLATLNKEINGVAAQYNSKKYEADFVVSQSKSSTKSVSFNGDNTHGPFSLNSFQILENSESVTLNGQVLAADKYYIEYYVGQITFCNPSDSTDCMTIKRSDTVQVNFEERLVLSLNAGAITAFSVKRNLSESGSIGFARVSQEAQRSRQQVLAADTLMLTGASVSSTPEGSFILLNCGAGQYHPGDRFCFVLDTSLKIYKNGAPLTKSADYSLDSAGYMEGVIKILGSYEQDDIFSVEYLYYVRDQIKPVLNEKLVYDGDDIYPLTQGLPRRIYPGSELAFNGVELCSNAECLPPESIPESSYIIDHIDNHIRITDAAYNPSGFDEWLRVSYFAVPATGGADESDYDHTVYQVFGTAAAGPVNFKFEYGRSESDVSNNPVSVVNEKLVRAPVEAVCPTVSGQPSGDCFFKLRNTNIVELSETVTWSENDQPLFAGRDYEMDYASGAITFRNNIAFAPETVLYASYRYLPDIEEGIVSANASRVSAETRMLGYTLQMKSESTDVFFSPLGGNNTLETSRADFSVSGSPAPNVALNVTTSRFKVAKDIYGTHSDDNRQLSVSTRWSPGLYSVGYEYARDTTRDNAPAPETDTERAAHTFTVGTAGLWRPGLKLDYSLSKEDFDDRAGSAPNRSTTSGAFAAQYRKDNTFDLKAVFKSSGTDSFGVGVPYSTTTNSRSAILTYYPAELITVTADINSQRVSDTRATAGNNGKDSTGVSIVALSRGRLQSVSLNMTKQSFPAYNTGGGSSYSSTSLASQYLLTSALMFSPTVRMFQTDSSGSSSDSISKIAKLEYRPQDKPFEAVLTREWSDTTATSASGSADDSGADIFSFDLKYKRSSKTVFVYRFGRTDMSGATSSSQNTTNTFMVERVPSETKKFNLSYYTLDTDSADSTSQSSLQFESSIKMSKILSWKTTFNKTSFSSSRDPESNDYSGYLMETKLQADF
ncbi:MAG TPA: hypothetical protein PKH33_14555 [bacterium]|nr:hypothetical protein [bacterium]